MENYQKYTSIFLMNSKSQETNCMCCLEGFWWVFSDSEWLESSFGVSAHAGDKKVCSLKKFDESSRPTPMVEDSSIESAEDHS